MNEYWPTREYLPRRARVGDLEAGLDGLKRRAFDAALIGGLRYPVELRAGELHALADAALTVLQLHWVEPDGHCCISCADTDDTGQLRRETWPCRTLITMLSMVRS